MHGTAADALAGVQVGDTVTIEENLGDGWQNMDFIIGCGPRLVENGRVHVTVDEEDFLRISASAARRAVPSASRRTAAISWPSSTAASRTASA